MEQVRSPSRKSMVASVVWTVSGVAYNLLLGVLAYFPIDFTYWLLSGPPPTNNRDSLPYFTAITIAAWLVLLLLAILPNMSIARRSAIPPKAYWPVAVVMLLVIPVTMMIPIIEMTQG